ncbi:hypothetical protein [Mycolicibacterium anyangense]|uniref:hypothetical protein n=1 Tax=Mycolicibacterium anyangense TaxID=1431246 RepID=UPI0013D3AFEC|nr:hypothetical protein [Mycolicibacterium anyangense]
MASGNVSIAPHGRTRMLELRTWLGAGALALGVGAALAGAGGVAQADTGRHQSSNSASDSKPDAGPARTTSVASAKRVNAPTAGVTATAASARSAKVNAVPLSAAAALSQSSAKARPATAVTANSIGGQLFNQTINTPFGPISLVANVSAPDLGQSGPLSLNVNATTPIGDATLALAGTTTFTTSPLKSTSTLTGGTFAVPAPVAFVASVAGAVINAGLTAYDSLHSVVTALGSGNILGAFGAWAQAAPQFTNALLFGAGTLDLPLQNGGSTGPSVVVHIPVGGLFSSLRPVSLTWGDYSYVDQTSGAEIGIVGGSIDFAGTQLGGAAPAFFKILGI